MLLGVLSNLRLIMEGRMSDEDELREEQSIARWRPESSPEEGEIESHGGLTPDLEEFLVLFITVCLLISLHL